MDLGHNRFNATMIGEVVDLQDLNQLSNCRWIRMSLRTARASGGRAATRACLPGRQASHG
jgi:hypothetical protein